MKVYNHCDGRRVVELHNARLELNAVSFIRMQNYDNASRKPNP